MFPEGGSQSDVIDKTFFCGSDSTKGMSNRLLASASVTYLQASCSLQALRNIKTLSLVYGYLQAACCSQVFRGHICTQRVVLPNFENRSLFRFFTTCKLVLLASASGAMILYAFSLWDLTCRQRDVCKYSLFTSLNDVVHGMS